MTRSDIQLTLELSYPHELVESVLNSYENALSEYKKSHWQYFGNEIGQFIEVVRRMIEYKLDNKFTLLSEKLKIFNEKVLNDWENHPSSISESYRIVIPRLIYAMYCIRNKRGMIHKSSIDPNKMDAAVLLNNAKWVLAELFRLASTMTFEETLSVIDSIMSKETTLVWDAGSCLRILDTKMSAKDKVLCLLYVKDNQTETELQKSIEYKNSTDFRKLLKALHKDRLIEYSASKCSLSPIGIERAEKLLAS